MPDDTIRYQFYPTLLDAYYRYTHTSLDDYFYRDELGAWHRNYNEQEGTYLVDEATMRANLLEDLIDTINRVDGEPSEAADKGTAFNEIIDCIVDGVPSTRPDVTLKSTPETIEADIHDFHFSFDRNLCCQVGKAFKGSLTQLRTEAVMPTAYGNVLLYGYIDSLLRDRVIDIKTTKRYDFGNYKHYMQRHVYPWCLTTSGEAKDISAFEFFVVKLSGGTPSSPLIRGEVYKEVYDYDHKQSTEVIRQSCERFIEFLNEHKHLITDKKIFNEHD